MKNEFVGIGFLKRNCVNWLDDPREECLIEEKCLVLAGEPCWYFEERVLCSEDYPYQPQEFLNNPKYARKVREAYKKINSEQKLKKKRLCPDCEVPLMGKQKYCEKCAAARRRKTMREYQRNRRQKRG